jgi:signal peptidase II
VTSDDAALAPTGLGSTEGAEGRDDRPSALRHPTSRRACIAVLILVALGVVALDRLTKAWAVGTMLPRMQSGEGPIDLLGPWLRLTYTENTGAAFSIGTGYTWIFSAFAVIVAVVIIRSSRRLGSIGWSVALGGLLGGLLGNLIDRITRPPGPGMGSVVDFIAFPNFPVFNVADMCIVGSAILMVLLSLRGIDYRGSAASS